MTAISISPRQLVPSGVRERFATVSGHRMRYLTAGTGPPLVLLPGLFGFSFSWSENLAALAQCATVYAPDLLNTGYSDPGQIDTSLSGIAEEVASFMDAVGISKVDVLGSSYGGSVAMALAAGCPDRIARLILVSPANCWSESRRFVVSLVSSSLGQVIGPKLRFLRKPGVRFFLWHVYYDSARILPGTVDGYSHPLKNPQTLKYAAAVAKSWFRDFANLKTSIPLLNNLPILLVWGKHDHVVPLKSAHIMLRHLRTAQLVTLETGHVPYEELPDEFNRVVIDFLLRSE